MFVIPTSGVQVRRTTAAAAGAREDWIDLGATLSAKRFDHVVALVPSLDDAGKRVAEILSSRCDDIDELSGERVLVFLAVALPPGQLIHSLDWAGSVDAQGNDIVADLNRRARSVSPLSLIAAIRRDLQSKGMPVPERTFALYLDFEMKRGDDPSAVDVYGEAVQLPEEPTEAQLMDLARAWGEAGESLSKKPWARGGLARGVHGGLFPSTLAWRLLGVDVQKTADVVKKWYDLVKTVAGGK